MAEERNKKNNHTGSKVAAGAIIAAALFAGGRFGFGIGTESGTGFFNQNSDTGEDAADEKTEEAVETVAENEDGVIAITVKEDGIEYNGASVTLGELEAAVLKDFKDDVEIRLTDDHAIKSTYEEVTSLLDKLEIPYTVEG